MEHDTVCNKKFILIAQRIGVGDGEYSILIGINNVCVSGEKSIFQKLLAERCVFCEQSAVLPPKRPISYFRVNFVRNLRL